MEIKNEFQFTCNLVYIIRSVTLSKPCNAQSLLYVLTGEFLWGEGGVDEGQWCDHPGLQNSKDSRQQEPVTLDGS